MKTAAGKAWEGFLASLLFHLAVAAVFLFGMPPGPAQAPMLPVIDLSLLPPSPGSGAGNGSGSAPVRARNAVHAADTRPAPVFSRTSSPEGPAPEQPDPAELSAAALSSSASSSGAVSSGAPSSSAPASQEFSPAASLPGNGPGASSAPASPSRGGASPVPGYGYLREAIQREISYPAVARKMGWEGRVVVAFVILTDGAVRDVRVVRGSGFSVLDRNAVEAVRSASPFPRPSAEAEVRTPIVYRLD